MRETLEILGLGPFHHMRALVQDSEHRQLWRAVNAGASPDWDLLLGDYKACVDWPTAYYWPQLIKAFPQARVILTWCTAESWWASFEQTLLPIIISHAEAKATPENEQLISTHVFHGKPLDREHCIATYEANVAAVKEQVAADRYWFMNQVMAGNHFVSTLECQCPTPHTQLATAPEILKTNFQTLK